MGLKACIYGASGLPPQKIAFSLHFLYRLLVILGSELIAGVIGYTVCGRCVSQQSGQLLCDIKVAVWIQMPIGSQSGLDFFVPQTFFDDQWVFAHTDQQGGVGMP